MKIDIHEIRNKSVLFEGDLSTRDYDLPLESYEKWESIHYRFLAEIIEKELLINGELASDVTVACARCTESIVVKLEIKDFTHSYEITENMESIDLTEKIREDILLALPFAPRCELDENNKCPIYGKIFNETKDEFTERNRTDVWSALDDLNKKE